MNLQARFKPRAEALLLSQLVQTAWQDYQDQIASPERQAEVAETITRYFETLIPAADFEVLERYGCIAYHDHCNVRVYDGSGERNRYGELLHHTEKLLGLNFSARFLFWEQAATDIPRLRRVSLSGERHPYVNWTAILPRCSPPASNTRLSTRPAISGPWSMAKKTASIQLGV